MILYWGEVLGVRKYCTSSTELFQKLNIYWHFKCFCYYDSHCRWISAIMFSLFIKVEKNDHLHWFLRHDYFQEKLTVNLGLPPPTPTSILPTPSPSKITLHDLPKYQKQEAERGRRISHALSDVNPILSICSDEQMQGGNLGRKDFWRKMFKSQSAASDTSSQSEQDTSECTTAHSGNTSDRRARSRSRRISLRKKLKLPIGKSMSAFIYGFSYCLPCHQINT
jgi:hypothetical protein